MNQNVTFTPIGRARSCYPDKFGTPRQPGLVPLAKAFLEINPEYQPEISLSGLSSYSHVWILFLFHMNKTERFHAKVHPPRLDGKTMGLFATRTPHRPNPIGLSVLEIVRIEKNGLWVKGVDIIDGTPILDIKPYLPEIESKPYATSGWTKGVEQKNPIIKWTDFAIQNLTDLINPDCREEFKSLIDDTVKLDPRPLVYKAENDSESKYRDSHIVRIQDIDIEFKFDDKNIAQILSVKLA